MSASARRHSGCSFSIFHLYPPQHLQRRDVLFLRRIIIPYCSAGSKKKHPKKHMSPAAIMEFDERPPPVKRPSLQGRNSSEQSVSRGSPSGPQANQRPKASKAHTVGRLNNRNSSSGKNLSKLVKLAGGIEGSGKTTSRKHTPATSPTTQNIKRNSSTASLPHTGSKVSVKKNPSNVSLKRNSSSTHMKKAPRPTTSLRRFHSDEQKVEGPQPKARVKFSVDTDEQDDEWTEEGASQSPSTTRHGSTKGSRSEKTTPAEAEPPDKGSKGVDVVAPAARHPGGAPSPEERRPLPAGPQSNHPSKQASRPPDADAVTSRLLSRPSSYKLAPTVSPISATGTPGAHTPPLVHTADRTPLDPSLTENGVSHFLDAAAASSGKSTSHLQNALSHLQTPPPSNRSRSPSPSANHTSEERVRRAKSVGNLSQPAVALGPNQAPGRRSPPSYTFEAAGQRRPGGNTQAKLDLWRTQSNVEPSHGPPGPLLKGVGPAAMGMLGTEERRARLWNDAEAEMGHLRRFRNPLVEGIGRLAKDRKSRKRESDGFRDGEAAKGREQSREGDGDPPRGRAPPSRPSSRPSSAAGRRSVRFEIGVDATGGDDEHDEGNAVEEILRRMWEGGEAEGACG